jgi:hypothetical protein
MTYFYYLLILTIIWSNYIIKKKLIFEYNAINNHLIISKETHHKQIMSVTTSNSSSKDVKSLPLIRTKSESWGIVKNLSQPIVNIPVISAIGTSRDGKSTSLNLYANWISNKCKGGKKHFSPFIAMQSDDVVTNGIDYYVVKDKCMLIDCQGMQLKDAKYDHFLMLLTYLMSNIIILTVRERLDLQVLNNCLGVFSFLSEIPAEFKRTDKPVLLIRIKDFQNYKQLKEDPDYLKKYVEKWLVQSNDQYDQIKQAFKNTFEIEVIATKYPTMNDDGEVEIHDKNFLKNNPTFEDYCKKLDKLCVGMKSSKILSNPKNLENLVNLLKENKTIDWKKLDLYHQITENELRKYLQDNLANHKELNDETIISSMNGSSQSYKLYYDRYHLIKDTENNVYNVKFKDVTEDIKREVFTQIFNKFYKIYTEAKNKNVELAEKIINPHLVKFDNKYKDPSFFSFCIDKITDYFSNNKKVLIQELDKIDCEVRENILKTINAEQTLTDEKQKQILGKNKAQKLKLKNLIKEYNIIQKTYNCIGDRIKHLINTKLFNEPVETTFNFIRQTIIGEIRVIYLDNDATWHMDNEKNIIVSKNKTQYFPENDFDNAVTRKMFDDVYWVKKETELYNLGFINSPSFSLSANNLIDFYFVECGRFKFLVVKRFYEKFIKNNIEKTFVINVNMDKIKITENTNKNLTSIKYEIKVENDITEVLPIFTQILENVMGEYLLKFPYNYGYSNCKLV